MVAKKRIRKHDLKEDRFVTTTFQVTTFVRENQNTFLAILAALVVMVIVIVVVTSGRSRTHDAAAQLMGEANMLYQARNYREAIQQCQIVLDQYGKSHEADLASFLLADSYFKLADYQHALDAYELYVQKYHHDRLLLATSLTGLAACYEYLGQFDEAGKFYMQAAVHHPDFYLAPESLMNAGRCYSTSGDIELAIKAYSKLVDDFPDSRYIDDAKMYVAELTTSLRKASLSGSNS